MRIWCLEVSPKTLSLSLTLFGGVILEIYVPIRHANTIRYQKYCYHAALAIRGFREQPNSNMQTT